MADSSFIPTAGPKFLHSTVKSSFPVSMVNTWAPTTPNLRERLASLEKSGLIRSRAILEVTGTIISGRPVLIISTSTSPPFATPMFAGSNPRHRHNSSSSRSFTLPRDFGGDCSMKILSTLPCRNLTYTGRLPSPVSCRSLISPSPPLISPSTDSKKKAAIVACPQVGTSHSGV